MALTDRVFVKPSRPSAGNKFFTTKSYGGYMDAVIGSPAAWPGSLLANCTGAAWGCFAQQENDPKCRIGCNGSNDWYGNAKMWIQYSRAQGYPIYSKPLLGGVIVWDKSGGYGHVAYITKVYSDGSFDTVESGYGSRSIWWTDHYPASGYRSGYSVLGYIGSKKYNYIEQPAVKIVDPVAKDITKDQVICHDDSLRVRTSPSLSGVKIGHILKDKYYNYFEVQKADGYNWYKLANNQWVAGIAELEVIPKLKLVEPVERDTKKDQVCSHTDFLRVRTQANLKGQVIGHLQKDKYYNFFGTTKADGYTWYKLAENQWCAGIEELEILPKSIVVDPVDRDPDKDQVICHTEGLRVRVAPSLKAEKIGFLLENKYYNFFETKVADGYTWYRIADNQWIAGIKELEILPKAIYYIVQEGDTLESIAKDNNISLDQLVKLNPQLAVVGNKLKIR